MSVGPGTHDLARVLGGVRSPGGQQALVGVPSSEAAGKLLQEPPCVHPFPPASRRLDQGPQLTGGKEAYGRAPSETGPPQLLHSARDPQPEPWTRTLPVCTILGDSEGARASRVAWEDPNRGVLVVKNLVRRSGSNNVETVEALLAENPVPSCVCPMCEQPLRLVARPTPRAVHVGGPCRKAPPKNAESVQHLGAKARLVSDLSPWKPIWVLLPGGVSPSILRVPPWVRAVEEFIVSRTPLRLDVALLDSWAKPVFALEVCDTSPVTPMKAKAFSDARIPWLEVGTNLPVLPWGSDQAPIEVIRCSIPGSLDTF